MYIMTFTPLLKEGNTRVKYLSGLVTFVITVTVTYTGT